MSSYNIKFKVWSKNGETRVYVSGTWVEYRDIWSHADGYLRTDETGVILWNHAFKAGPATITRCEMNAMAMRDIIETLRCATFAELLERIAQCQTKSGNFSFRQYEKKYILPKMEK